ncbi:hypothetical protein [Brevundimonas sp.]|uniref:hypothetical protein n=1 Tax=Brevundimonas sp. TaxID=1871086 RepID=UPI001A1BB895|nr:hypothetical protein [Brevundimonas sp.]MBJ7484345.1 hypothetical protein [Brevundimonas sp.]
MARPNVGLTPLELTVLQGLVWPIFQDLRGQGGGSMVTIKMPVARVRKIRRAIYPPSPELAAAMDTLTRTKDSEAVRRSLRAIEYSEKTGQVQS